MIEDKKESNKQKEEEIKKSLFTTIYIKRKTPYSNLNHIFSIN